MKGFKYNIESRLDKSLARAGTISTPHGEINTPAFITVGTKATVKAVSPEQVRNLGSQAVLANTYHLHLEPGEETVKKAGGLHKFMNWPGPMFTDSGGFQVFSLGQAYGKGGVSKVARGEIEDNGKRSENKIPLAKIDEEGVSFKSHIDGSAKRLTPEISMQIQHDLGANIIFAFDECTTPQAPFEYQKEAMERTHRWAERSLAKHQELNAKQENYQALFGIVQGGNFKDLRVESAKEIGGLEFDGFGVGGSFAKEDISQIVGLVNSNLPEEKPRHLLGIGEVEDLFLGIENGVDTFDCVSPTREARNGTLQTTTGKINILNTKFRQDFTPIESTCQCYTCQNYTKAYLSHLFRSREMLAATLASIHNLHFLVKLTDNIRQSIINGSFFEYKNEFLKRYLTD